MDGAIAKVRRFYPDEIAPFPGEPSPEDFAVAYIGPDVGYGVVSRRAFEPGEEIFTFSGVVGSEITQFSLQLPDGRHIHDPWFMGKVLHHCDPNAVVDMERRVFVARYAIRPGDCVTMDYAQTEDYLFRVFECQCDAALCRGTVKGRLQ